MGVNFLFCSSCQRCVKVSCRNIRKYIGFCFYYIFDVRTRTTNLYNVTRKGEFESFDMTDQLYVKGAIRQIQFSLVNWSVSIG